MQIHTIDLHFQGVTQSIASFLVIGPSGPFLVETGPATTIANLVERLAEHGVAPDDLRDVFVSHIHLDHAGAAGWWGRRGARVHVHERGAPHLVDPSKLLASASRIYGDRMDELWGEVLPVPEDRVHVVADDEAVQAGGVELIAMDTPGHARHHHVWRMGDVAFTGDAAGIHVPGSLLVDLPAPPPEFDLEAWMETVEKLRVAHFRRLYPTHFGPIDDVDDRLAALKRLLVEAVGVVESYLREGLDREAMVERYVAWTRKRARDAGIDDAMIRRYETANPPCMSVDGIARYVRRRDERPASDGAPAARG